MGRADGHPPVILHHGSNAAFWRFDEAMLGTGGDANSALGFHLSRNFCDCVEYAVTRASRLGGTAVVATVEAALGPLAALDYYEFFGFDQNGDEEKGHAEMAALRRSLLAEGYGGIDYEDGEQDIITALDPSLLRIVRWDPVS